MAISTPYALTETIAQLKAIPNSQRVRKLTLLVFEGKAWYTYDPDTVYSGLSDQIKPNDGIGVWWRLSDSSVASYQTLNPISANRAVSLNSDNKLIYADPNNNPIVAGISLNAAGSNSNLLISSTGFLYDSSFTFTKGNLIYVGSNGTLTTTPDYNATYICKVGICTGTHQIKLNIETPIKNLI